VERRALILALALTVPLALWGIPYVYAATTSSSYVAYTGFTVSGPGEGNAIASCNPGDYATGGGYGLIGTDSHVRDFYPNPNTAGGTPTGYYIDVITSASGLIEFQVFAICQTPITVAGIGVPQFGSLYIAIALGALVYFALSRRYSKRVSISSPTSSPQVEA